MHDADQVEVNLPNRAGGTSRNVCCCDYPRRAQNRFPGVSGVLIGDSSASHPSVTIGQHSLLAWDSTRSCSEPKERFRKGVILKPPALVRIPAQHLDNGCVGRHDA